MPRWPQFREPRAEDVTGGSLRFLDGHAAIEIFATLIPPKERYRILENRESWMVPSAAVGIVLQELLDAYMRSPPAIFVMDNAGPYP